MTWFRIEEIGSFLFINKKKRYKKIVIKFWKFPWLANCSTKCFNSSLVQTTNEEKQFVFSSKSFPNSLAVSCKWSKNERQNFAEWRIKFPSIKSDFCAYFWDAERAFKNSRAAFRSFIKSSKFIQNLIYILFRDFLNLTKLFEPALAELYKELSRNSLTPWPSAKGSIRRRA